MSFTELPVPIEAGEDRRTTPGRKACGCDDGLRVALPPLDGCGDLGWLRGDDPGEGDEGAGACRGWAVPPVPGPLRGPAVEPESNPPEEEPPDEVPPDESPPPLRLPCPEDVGGSARATATTTDVMSEKWVVMAVLG